MEQQAKRGKAKEMVRSGRQVKLCLLSVPAGRPGWLAKRRSRLVLSLDRLMRSCLDRLHVLGLLRLLCLLRHAQSYARSSTPTMHSSDRQG
jgi:hypothetical protein